jgi:hypothetical protein
MVVVAVVFGSTVSGASTSAKGFAVFFVGEVVEAVGILLGAAEVGDFELVVGQVEGELVVLVGLTVGFPVGIPVVGITVGFTD